MTTKQISANRSRQSVGRIFAMVFIISLLALTSRVFANGSSKR